MSPAHAPSLLQLDDLLRDLESLLGEPDPDLNRLGSIRAALSGWANGSATRNQA
ncbi:MAG: hypothetical protein VKP72_03240 [bacterium]|nr:hypothetical protein [bacterium]